MWQKFRLVLSLCDIRALSYCEFNLNKETLKAI